MTWRVGQQAWLKVRIEQVREYYISARIIMRYGKYKYGYEFSVDQHGLRPLRRPRRRKRP